MVNKTEIINAVRAEVRILLHLLSKVDEEMLDYRPNPKQRSMLELVRYLTLMGPIHVRAILAPSFDLKAWSAAWTTGEATAKTFRLNDARESIRGQSALFDELLTACSESDLQAEIEMFGQKASRDDDREPGSMPRGRIPHAAVPVFEGVRTR